VIFDFFKCKKGNSGRNCSNILSDFISWMRFLEILLSGAKSILLISVDDEKWENVNAEQIISTLNIIDDNNCTQDATTSLSEENFQATSLYFKKFIVPPLLLQKMENASIFICTK
jgi:hypothetical protein